jgi:FkbM family methyltransferase
MLLSKLMIYSGKVYSFEPTSSRFKKLQDRIPSLKINNVNCLQNAIYYENRLMEFNKFPQNFSALSSISRPQMLYPLLDPQGSGQLIPIVKIEIIAAIKLDSF